MLGCAQNYAAAIHERGGRRRVVTLSGITRIGWERKLDDFSDATVVLAKAKASRACLRSLGPIEPWQHEVSLYRDGQRVWEGPLFDFEESRASITLTARDPLAWLTRRALHTVAPAGPVNAAAYADTVIRDALGYAGQDPNLIPFLQITTTNSPTTQRETQPLTVTAGAELAEIAKAGLDYFAIGRSIHVLPDRVDYTVRPYRLREEHFLADLTVRKVGSEAATKAYVVGTGETGAAPVGEFGGPAAGYGLIENVSTSQNTSDLGVLAGIGAKVVGYGNPVPYTVLVPTGSQLSPRAPIGIPDLVPGRYIQVAIANYAVPVLALMKLNQVGCSWTPDTPEQVSVALIPKDVFDLPPAELAELVAADHARGGVLAGAR